MTGIYKITNLDNGKMYIGQAVDINRRWKEHVQLLNKNQHSNSRLQNSWNCHGGNRFDFSVIEECEIDELDDLEMYWIDKLRTYTGFKDCNGYNETLGGDGNRRLTKDAVIHVCELYNSGKYESVSKLAEYLKWKPKRVRRYLVYGTIYGICDYDPTRKMEEAHVVKVICLNNKEIFNSVKEAEDFYNIHGVSSCCIGKHKYAGKNKNGESLMWMYLNDYNKMSMDEVEKYISDLKSEICSMYVVRLNDGKMYENSLFAAKDVGIKTPNSIQSCCNHKTKHSGKNKDTGEYYVWLYYKDYIKLSADEINKLISDGQCSTTNPPKKVICLNNSMIFNNPTEAAAWASDTNQQLIKNCCLNSTNSAGKDPLSGNYLTWMYFDDFLKVDKFFIDNKLLLSKYKRTNPNKSKNIVCLNNNYLFLNQTEAALWCGLKNPSNIGQNIKKNKYIGKHPETGEKLKWMYYDDYIKEFDKSTLIEYRSA